MKNIKKLSFIFLGLFILSSVGSTNPIQAKTNSTNSVDLSGSLLNPNYLYISGQTMDNAAGKQFSISTGNQPSYFTSYSFIGTSLYSSNDPYQYIPANFDSNSANGIYNLLGFQSASYLNPDSKAYFLKYGNIVPTATEKDAITNPSSPNYISYPDYSSYMNNYPYTDQNYEGSTATDPATMQLTDHGIQSTINLDNWFKFNTNSTSSYSLVLEADVGLYAVIAVQNYGSSTISMSSKSIPSTYFSLSGTQANYQFLSKFDSKNDLIHINLASSSDSEVFIRVVKLNINQRNLNLNDQVSDSHDFKVSDQSYSADPFKFLESTHVNAFKFTVPNSLDGKTISFKFSYSASNPSYPYYYYSWPSNLYIFSEMSNKTVDSNSNVIAHAGEVFDILFTTYDNAYYYYSLEVIKTSNLLYTPGNTLDLTFSTAPTYQFSVTTAGLYEYFMDIGYNSYCTARIYNSTGYQVSYASSSYDRTGLVDLQPDTYYLMISGSGLGEFGLSAKSSSSSSTPTTISYRSGGLYKINTVTGPNSYSFNVSLTDPNSFGSSVYVYVYRSDLTQIFYSNYINLPTATSSDFSFQIPGGYSGPAYFYIIPTAIIPSTSNGISISLSYSEQSGSTTPTTMPEASYDSPGTYLLPAGSYNTQFVQFNLNGLTPKTWNLIKIQATNVGFNYNVQMHITDLISYSESAFNYMPDFSTRMENNVPETIFGFGALAPTASVSFEIYLQSTSFDGNVTISLQKMNTAELVIGDQALGPVMQATNVNVDLANFTPSGASPGFELYIFMFAITMPVLIKKIKSKKSN